MASRRGVARAPLFNCGLRRRAAGKRRTSAAGVAVHWPPGPRHAPPTCSGTPTTAVRVQSIHSRSRTVYTHCPFRYNRRDVSRATIYKILNNYYHYYLYLFNFRLTPLRPKHHHHVRVFFRITLCTRNHFVRRRGFFFFSFLHYIILCSISILYERSIEVYAYTYSGTHRLTHTELWSRTDKSLM